MAASEIIAWALFVVLGITLLRVSLTSLQRKNELRRAKQSLKDFSDTLERERKRFLGFERLTWIANLIKNPDQFKVVSAVLTQLGYVNLQAEMKAAIDSQKSQLGTVRERIRRRDGEGQTDLQILERKETTLEDLMTLQRLFQIGTAPAGALSGDVAEG